MPGKRHSDGKEVLRTGKLAPFILVEDSCKLWRTLNRSFPNSKGVQEGPELSAQDAKAVEALNEANPQSIKDNLEYGGFIYQNPNGTYDYTTPLQGADKSFDLTAAEDLVPKGSVIVGNYHTHGDYSIYDQETGAFIRTGDPARDDLNSDNFSSGDIRVCTINAEKGYLGTPSGVFRAYDPIEKRDYVIKP
jgi:hypothetical protein